MGIGVLCLKVEERRDAGRSIEDGEHGPQLRGYVGPAPR